MIDAEFFTEAELACNHCGECHMDGDFVKDLDRIRKFVGHPLYANSAYRCAEYDAAIGGAGIHPTGKAIDFSSPDGSLAGKIMEAALPLGFKGFGFALHGPRRNRFIHLDKARPTLVIWSYS